MAAIETEVVFPRGRAVSPEILDKRREAQDRRRWKEEIRGREAKYLGALLERYPDFFKPYQYFFPPGAVEATLKYYSSPVASPPPENLHLVRRLIYLTGQRPRNLPPLPMGTFLVTEKVAEQFKDLWQNSPLSFFSGKVSKDFPSKEDL